MTEHLPSMNKTLCSIPHTTKTNKNERVNAGGECALGSSDSLFLTCLCVAHPIQDDLWCPVPPGHHIARHLTVCLSG